MNKISFIVLFGFLALFAGGFAPRLAAQTKKAAPKAAKALPKAGEKPLPNLILNTVEGEKWSLHEQRGRVVLMNFWATWCAPCQEEVPYLVNLFAKYKERGLVVVGVTIDSENTDQIKDFIERFKVDYPVILTVPGSLLSKQKAVPMTLLIDEKGVLVNKYAGAAPESLLEKDIIQLINKKSGEKELKLRAN